MKNIITILLTVICLQSFAQVDTVIRTRPDTNRARNAARDTGRRVVTPARPVDSAQIKARRLALALRRDSLRRDSIRRATAGTGSLRQDNTLPDSAQIKARRLALALRRDSLRRDSIRRATAGTGSLRQDSTLTDSARLALNRLDSLRTDSTKADSIRKATAAKKAAPPGMEGQLRASTGKDDLFYILAGLLLFLGFIKIAYPRYFQNIFKTFFQTSLRQKQTPEQIVQGYVPGFLLTLMFFMVGGMFIAIYAAEQNILKGPLWLLVLFCSGILACVYLVKYLVTVFAGFVFNVKDAVGTYSFIVFLVNRVMAIILLPLLILLAFYGGDARAVMFTIAASIVIILLIYRYVLSLTVIRKNLKVSALHFFIYLCAVELMPLLVIYKVLFIEIAKNK